MRRRPRSPRTPPQQASGHLNTARPLQRSDLSVKCVCVSQDVAKPGFTVCYLQPAFALSMLLYVIARLFLILRTRDGVCPGALQWRVMGVGREGSELQSYHCSHTELRNRNRQDSSGVGLREDRLVDYCC